MKRNTLYQQFPQYIYWVVVRSLSVCHPGKWRRQRDGYSPESKSHSRQAASAGCQKKKKPCIDKMQLLSFNQWDRS